MSRVVAAKRFVPRDLVGFQVGHGELRLVVEHLFEVRDVPARIGGVAVEAAAEVVVDAARGHVSQGDEIHFQRLLSPAAANPPWLGPRVEAGEQVERDRAGELRRAAEAAVDGVEAGGELRVGGGRGARGRGRRLSQGGPGQRP